MEDILLILIVGILIYLVGRKIFNYYFGSYECGNVIFDDETENLEKHIHIISKRPVEIQIKGHTAVLITLRNRDGDLLHEIMVSAIDTYGVRKR